MERALAATDDFAPLNLAVEVEIAGPALTDVLPGALQRLQDHHPLLRANIDRGARRPVFRFDGSGPLPIQLLAPGLDAPGAAIEAELAERFDTARGPLARCAYAPDSGRLLLTFHHTIADGPSAAACIDELLTSCRRMLEGVSAVPPTAEREGPHNGPTHRPRGGRRRAVDTLAYATRAGAEELALLVANRGTRRPVPTTGRSRVVTVRLDRDTTIAVVNATRRRRITVTSLLTAALLWLAEARLANRSPRHRGVAWTDLRPHLTPPAPSSTLGCHVSMLRFVVPAGTDLWTTAEHVGVALTRAARRGDRFDALALSDTMAKFATRWPANRLATAAVSYAPWTAPARSYGAIDVRSVTAAVSNNRIGAEIAAVAGVFDGALWCNVICLDSEVSATDAVALGHALEQLLVGVA